MTRLTVVVGAQYGSEGKGAIAGYLGRSMEGRGLAIRVAGPNAGHTAYDKDGREWKLRAVPVAAATSEDCHLHIAAGSEVDLDVLADEITRLETAGHAVLDRLTIHPSATILDRGHQDEERSRQLTNRIGSTGKGIGAARADRIWRTARTFADVATEPQLLPPILRMSNLMSEWDLALAGHDEIVIEGTQGYGLGLHTANYPKVTSSDCRAIDFLAMAGISPWDSCIEEFRAILVARVYPIRVAGNSGPMRGETSWAELGLPEERTTVTNKVRRVGEWDWGLIQQAIWANGGGDWSLRVKLAITMLDQLYPELRDQTKIDHDRAHGFIDEIESRTQTEVAFVGTGPNTVVEL